MWRSAVREARVCVQRSLTENTECLSVGISGRDLCLSQASVGVWVSVVRHTVCKELADNLGVPRLRSKREWRALGVIWCEW